MALARVAIDVTPDILVRAYAAGLFPMAASATEDRLFWVDPEQRGIFPLDGMSVSRSLAKTVRSDRFQVVADRDFPGVIAGCAAAANDRPKTWINRRIWALFETLYKHGRVHTIEAYRGDELVGGLYGLQIGGAFFGESMFHRATDASKVCLVHLAARLIAGGFTLLDAQFLTPHLATLGAVEVDRARYLDLLGSALEREATFRAFGDAAGNRGPGGPVDRPGGDPPRRGGPHPVELKGSTGGDYARPAGLSSSRPVVAFAQRS